MIVDSGLNLIRDFLNGDAPNPPSHMAFGSGTSAVTAADTSLGSEVIRKSISKEEKATPGVIEYTVTIDSTEANGSNLSEFGVFNASSGGTMLMRKTHLVYQKTASFGVKVKVRHTIQST